MKNKELGFDFVILGMGATARSLIRYCVDNGWKVCLSEKRLLNSEEKDFLKKYSVSFEEGGHSVEFLNKAYYVVPSPSVRWDRLSIEPERILSEIDFAFGELQKREKVPKVIAITGTNGKTTTVSMLAWMIERAGYNCCVCGNIGVPFVEVVNRDVDFVVVEVSSFQLFSSKLFCPDVFVVLNIREDHLDWHKSMDEYAWSKLSLIDSVRGNGGLVIVDKMSKVWLNRFHLGESGICFIDGERKDLSYCVCKLVLSFLRIEPVDINISQFRRPDFRMQKVLEKDGVLFINDSKATNPSATAWGIRQLEDYRGKIILICGGRNKGLDMKLEDDLVSFLKCVIAFGESRDEIEEIFSKKVCCYKYVILWDAVRRAVSLAEEGDIVLFSPMCCSFDQYMNYVERGWHFNELVEKVVFTNK